MKRMSGLLMLLVAAGIVVGCSSLDKVKPIIDDAKDIIDQVDGDKPTPPPAPVPPAPTPEPKPEPKPEPVNKDPEGFGLYKPESSLWLLQVSNPTNGRRLMPSDIGTAGIYVDREGTQIARDDKGRPRWLTWPMGVDPAIAGGQIDGTIRRPTDTQNDYWHPKYVGGRIKMRSVRPKGGQYLIVRDIYGKEVAWMRVIDANVRQEGRSK